MSHVVPEGLCSLAAKRRNLWAPKHHAMSVKALDTVLRIKIWHLIHLADAQVMN